MSQTIVVDFSEDAVKKLAINLRAYLGTDVIERTSGEEVLNLLRILPEVDLIIARDVIGEEATADKIIKYVDQQDMLIPVIVMGETDIKDEFVHKLQNPNSWEEAVKAAGEKLGVSQIEMAKRVTPNFFPFPLFYFSKVDKTCVDIYLKTKNENNRIDYVKKVRSGEFFEKSLFEKLEKENLKYFFVKEEEKINLLNFVSSRLSEMLEDDYISLERRVRLASHTFDVIGHQVRNIELKEATTQLAQSVVDSVVYSVNHIPEKEILLQVFDKVKPSYSYQMFHLASSISYDIIRRMDWGTQDHHERLTFGILFNDISLSTDELVKIRTEKDLTSSKLSPAERERVRYHAARGHEILRVSGDAPRGSEMIVKYQHGNEEGVGFPLKITETFSPLANINIVSGDIADFMLKKRPDKKSLFSYVEGLSKKFEHEAFDEILENFLKKLDE